MKEKKKETHKCCQSGISFKLFKTLNVLSSCEAFHTTWDTNIWVYLSSFMVLNNLLCSIILYVCLCFIIVLFSCISFSSEGGGDESTAKKISKDLTQRIKSAKAQPQFYEEDNDEDDEDERSEEEKPKRRKKKKKKAPVDSDDD